METSYGHQELFAGVQRHCDYAVCQPGARKFVPPAWLCVSGSQSALGKDSLVFPFQEHLFKTPGPLADQAPVETQSGPTQQVMGPSDFALEQAALRMMLPNHRRPVLIHPVAKTQGNVCISSPDPTGSPGEAEVHFLHSSSCRCL